MAKKLQLKNNVNLQVNGIGQVDNSNITPELLERLKKLNPAYGEMFHEVEVSVKEVKPKTVNKTTNGNGI